MGKGPGGVFFVGRSSLSRRVRSTIIVYDSGSLLPYRLVVAIVTYCILGAVLNHVKYQARGCDIFPNRKFWFLLPLLIKVSSFCIAHVEVLYNLYI